MSIRKNQTLKEYIIHLCRLHNISLKQFSDRLTIHQATFYSILNYKNTMSLKTYFEFAEVFAEMSAYPEEYFLKRLKEHIKQKEDNNE